MVKIGELAIGERPRVVGTVSSLETLRRCAEGELRPACDIIEIRLDLLGGDYDTWSVLRPMVQALSDPVLLTIRLASEGGRWEGQEGERLALFEHAIPFVDAVDVECRSEKVSEVVALAHSAGKAVIVSYHDFDMTPEFEELQTVLHQITSMGDVVAKIVTTIHEPSEVARLEGLLIEGAPVPLCVMGMGALGLESRVALARRGSCLTYGYIDEAVAPGQSSAKELTAHLQAGH